MYTKWTRLADVNLRLSARFEQTLRYYPDPAEQGGPREGPAVSIPESDWQEYIESGLADVPHTEYSMLTPYISDALMRRDRVIIHAAAVRFQDHAYLITGHSGVGKSTQVRNLQSLCPGEFGVICGDRPILEFRRKTADGSSNRCDPAAQAKTKASARGEEWEIIVHPSPWNGKENWSGAEACPLAGLILLRRGDKNRLWSAAPKEVITEFYPYLIQTYWEAELVRKAAELESRLLMAVPAWHLSTYQVPDSTKLLLESVFSGCSWKRGTDDEI